MGSWSEELVRGRAHELWAAAGQPEGRDLEFWLQAEQEIGAAADEPNERAVENPIDDVASTAVEAISGFVNPRI